MPLSDWASQYLLDALGHPAAHSEIKGLFDDPVHNTVDNLTAKAGGGQSGATPLAAAINRFTTVASGNDSAILPASKPGLSRTVVNAHASNSMNVFPAVGDGINALSANSAFAVAAGKMCYFVCTAAGRWHTILSA